MREAHEEFQAAIASVERAYRTVTVRYLAGRHEPNGAWRLMHAHVTLEPHARHVPTRRYRSPRLRAGAFVATGETCAPVALVAMLLRGEFPTEDDPIAFMARDTGGYDVHVLRSYPDVATSTQNRIGLRITGGWVQNAAPVHDVGWELLGAEPPFETLQELANAFDLGPMQQQHNIVVEMWTEPVVHFAEETGIAGCEAQVAIRLAPALERDHVRIGRKIRYATQSEGPLTGAELTWTNSAEGHCGIHRFAVAEHSEWLCTLQYGDSVQGFGVLRDRSIIANDRRILYESVDPCLSKLTASLEAFKIAEQNSVEFELLVERLFWLSGFNPVYLGKDKKTERAGDIIALAPDDDILLIECTTGILKKDKRSQLLRRAQKPRDALEKSPVGARTVIPVMLTCLPWREAQADAEDAQADGIAIFGYEDITKLLVTSAAPADPAGIVGTLRQRLAIAAIGETDTIGEFLAG